MLHWFDSFTVFNALAGVHARTDTVFAFSVYEFPLCRF